MRPGHESSNHMYTALIGWLYWCRCRLTCRWRTSGGLPWLPGGGAELRPGAVVHGTLQAARVLRCRGGGVASRPGRPHRVPGGPECPAALSPAAGLQMSAWLSQGGALPQGLLDSEVRRWVRAVGVSLPACLSVPLGARLWWCLNSEWTLVFTILFTQCLSTKTLLKVVNNQLH